jgi:hypothetical protein
MDMEHLAEIEKSIRNAEDALLRLQEQKEFLLDQIASLKREKEFLLKSGVAESPARYPSIGIGMQSDEQSKISLFRSLFRGREDVYPKRFESRSTGKSGYQPDCRNEWISGICGKPQTKCSRCDRREFVPVSDEVIRRHLRHQELGDCSAFVKIADEEPWNQDHFAGWKTRDVHGPLPEKLTVTLANQLYILRNQLSSSLCNRLVRTVERSLTDCSRSSRLNRRIEER